MVKTEAEFVKQLIPSFSKHFKVTQEVWSKCGNGRIDLVLSLNDNIHFGLECKTPDSKRGEQIGEYVKQAIRYTNYEFKINGIYKKIPILICPPLSYKYFLLNDKTIIGEETCFGHNKWHQDRHNEFASHHSMNGFLGSFSIGEVRKHEDGSYFFSVSNKTIFSSRKKWKQDEVTGLHEKNYINLLKKLGI